MSNWETGPASKDIAKGKKFPMKKVGSDHKINLSLTNSTDQARRAIMGTKWSQGVKDGFHKNIESTIKSKKPSSGK
jgi:hypothetical protein